MGLRFDSPVRFEVVGTAAYVPEEVRHPNGASFPTVTNQHIHEILYGPNFAEVLRAQGRDEDYTRRVLGFEHRYWSHWVGSPPSHDEVTSADLCYEAARRALDAASVTADAVDLFLCPTTTPPKLTSSTAAQVGGRLGIRAPCLDIKSGCSSGLYALLTASMYIAQGARTVLVAGAETLSKISSPRLPQSALTVGDGGAALVLRAAPGKTTGMLAGYMDADGRYSNLITTPGIYPATHEAIDRGDYYLAGDPSTLKDVVGPLWPISVRQALEAARMKPADVDLYVPHQVGLPIIRASADALGFAPEKTYVNLHRRGNVGGTSLLLALADGCAEGAIRPGMVLALNVVGGGLTWAGMLLSW